MYTVWYRVGCCNGQFLPWQTYDSDSVIFVIFENTCSNKKRQSMSVSQKENSLNYDVE